MTESKTFPKVIIVTHSWEEALRLHEHVDGNRSWTHDFEKEQYAYGKKTYNKVWYWHVAENCALSGSSGSDAIKSHIRSTGTEETVTVDTFVMMAGPEWKIDNDPYMKEIKDEDGMQAVADAGYFIDSTTKPEDIDYMLDIPTTPIAHIMKAKRTDNAVVLLSAGSFNPPHQGHFDMMDAAKEAMERVGKTVLAGYVSPGHDEYIKHKSGDKAIPIHKRIQMCEEMCPDWVSVDPWEGIFNKHAIMFTHVVERLERYLERHVGYKIPVVFVCGTDNLAYMKAFQKRGHCVVVGRPGYMPPGNQEDERFTYAIGTNTMSSTQLRVNMGGGDIHPEKVNLHLRAEDTLFQEVNAPWEDLLSIVSDEYAQVKTSLLSQQIEDFKDISKIGSILSLDPFMPGTYNLRISRHYDMFGSKMLKFDRAPEADPLSEQLKRIRSKEFYIFDDDIHTTGGTMRYVSGLVYRLGLKNKGAITFKVSDDSEGEILDLRDFFIHSDNCGLIFQMPDGSGVRTPYVYPYVCPYARAQVTDPMGFSIKVWEFNKAYHEKAGTLAKDLGSMGELFAYAGMVESDNELVADVCERHIQLLKKLR